MKLGLNILCTTLGVLDYWKPCLTYQMLFKQQQAWMATKNNVQLVRKEHIYSYMIEVRVAMYCSKQTIRTLKLQYNFWSNYYYYYYYTWANGWFRPMLIFSEMLFKLTSSQEVVFRCFKHRTPSQTVNVIRLGIGCTANVVSQFFHELEYRQLSASN